MWINIASDLFSDLNHCFKPIDLQSGVAELIPILGEHEIVSREPGKKIAGLKICPLITLNLHSREYNREEQYFHTVMAVVLGACLCGGITFEVSGSPEAVLQCYCNHCQKNAGGPFQIVSVTIHPTNIVFNDSTGCQI
jgi:hypothetical protein